MLGHITFGPGYLRASLLGTQHSGGPAFWRASLFAGKPNGVPAGRSNDGQA